MKNTERHTHTRRSPPQIPSTALKHVAKSGLDAPLTAERSIKARLIMPNSQRRKSNLSSSAYKDFLLPLPMTQSFFCRPSRTSRVARFSISASCCGGETNLIFHDDQRPRHKFSPELTRRPASAGLSERGLRAATLLFCTPYTLLLLLLPNPHLSLQASFISHSKSETRRSAHSLFRNTSLNYA